MSKKTVQTQQTHDIIASDSKPEDILDFTDLDFDDLMDLRVDYAFKLLFSAENTHRLVHLLNAIFENKQIPRVITSLTIANPYLDKVSAADKLSILDIRATLDNGSTASIEMHLYDLKNITYKTLRSWARIYSEELMPGQEYSELNPVVSISFINGPITDAAGKPITRIPRIHSLFKAMERDSHEVLLDDMELHYINMKAFVKHCTKTGEDKVNAEKFRKWLILITQKAIKDKQLLKNICAEEEIREAMSALNKMSKNKIQRQAYQRRLDELRSYNSIIKQIAEKEAALADKDAAIEEFTSANAELKTANAELQTANAELTTVNAELITANAEKDALIAKLKAMLPQNE